MVHYTMTAVSFSASKGVDELVVVVVVVFVVVDDVINDAVFVVVVVAVVLLEVFVAGTVGAVL